MAFSSDFDVPKEYRSYLPELQEKKIYLPAFMDGYAVGLEASGKDHSEPTYKKNVLNV